MAKVFSGFVGFAEFGRFFPKARWVTWRIVELWNEAGLPPQARVLVIVATSQASGTGADYWEDRAHSRAALDWRAGW